MDCSSPGFSVYGILQARILEGITMPSSRGSSLPRGWTQVTWIARGFFIYWTTLKPNFFCEKEIASISIATDFLFHLREV